MKHSRTPLYAFVAFAATFAMIIGCGGGGGGTNGSTNTGSTNNGSTNNGSTNTGSTNNGSTNTGSTNNGSTNTGSTNTGSTNTGSTTGGAGDLPTNTIFYSTFDGSNTVIHTISPDGTNDATFDTLPAGFAGYAPNPAGNDVAFGYSSNVANPSFKIYKNTSVSAAGATLLSGANSFQVVSSLQYTGDGSKLVFVAQTTTGASGVWVVNTNGTGLVRLDDADDAALDPTGTKVVYSRLFTNGEICVKNLDNTGFVRLTTNADEDLFPQWSKDGTQIVFSSDRGGSSFDIYRMPATVNGAATVVANGPFDELGSSFGPTDTQVAYTVIASDPASSGLYRIDTDGQNPFTIKLVQNIDTPVYWTPATATSRSIGGTSGLFQMPSSRERKLIGHR